jgi:hypothetical protein
MQYRWFRGHVSEPRQGAISRSHIIPSRAEIVSRHHRVLVPRRSNLNMVSPSNAGPDRGVEELAHGHTYVLSSRRRRSNHTASVTPRVILLAQVMFQICRAQPSDTLYRGTPRNASPSRRDSVQADMALSTHPIIIPQTWYFLASSDGSVRPNATSDINHVIPDDCLVLHGFPIYSHGWAMPDQLAEPSGVYVDV